MRKWEEQNYEYIGADESGKGEWLASPEAMGNGWAEFRKCSAQYLVDTVDIYGCLSFLDDATEFCYSGGSMRGSCRRRPLGEDPGGYFAFLQKTEISQRPSTLRERAVNVA